MFLLSHNHVFSSLRHVVQLQEKISLPLSPSARATVTFVTDRVSGVLRPPLCNPHSSFASQADASDTDYPDQVQVNDAVTQRHWDTAMAETVYVAGCPCAFCSMRHSVCTVPLVIVFLLTFNQRKLMTMQIPDVPPRGPVRGAIITVGCLQLAASCKYYTHRRIWVPLAPFLIPHRTPRATLSIILLEGMTQRLPH